MIPDKKEVPSRERAIQVAEEARAEDPSVRCLIYAVSGVQSCYVQTIKGSLA